MRRKGLITVLAAILCFCLCSCGNSGENESAEQTTTETAIDYDNAIQITPKDFRADVRGNEARVTTYKGNTYKIAGYIKEIYTDYCVIAAESKDWTEEKRMFDVDFYLRCHFDTSTLATFNKGDKITFYGVLSDYETKEDDFGIGMTVKALYIDLEPCELVNE